MKQYIRALGNYSIKSNVMKCYNLQGTNGSLWLSIFGGIHDGKPVSEYYSESGNPLWSLEYDLKTNKVEEQCIQTKWEF